MKKNSGSPETKVLEVVSVSIPLDPRVEPGSIEKFLEECGFRNVAIKEGVVTGDAPPWIFCTYVPKRTMGGSFEIFCIDQNKKKIALDRGSTFYIGPCAHYTDLLELMVRGDAYVVWNILACPTSAESSLRLEVVKKEEDTLSKIEKLKKMFGKTT